MTDAEAGFQPIERDPGPFGQLAGPFFIRPGPPDRYGLRIRPAHANLHGVAHGGLLMTFTDHMLGYAVLAALDGERAVTMSLNCDLVRGAMPGDWIEGQAELVRITRSVVFVRGTLYRGADVVLTAAGVWKRVRG